MLRTPIKADTTATPACFSAPLVLLKVATGGVTDFVGDPPAVAMGMIGAATVPFADNVDAVPLPDICDVVEFAKPVAKPELAVTLGADIDTTVVFDEGAAVGVAVGIV